MKTSTLPAATSTPLVRVNRTARLAVAALALLALGACGDDDTTGDPAGGSSAGSQPGSDPLASDSSPGPTSSADEEPTADATSEAPATPADSEGGTDEQPELITYAGGEAVGPLIRTSADVEDLKGAPDDFKEFIGRAADELSEQIDCADADGVGFSVDLIRTDGFAAGDVRDCGGGARVLWALVDGEWQEVGATQEIWDCALLEQYRIPTDILFGETACYDAEAGAEGTHTQA